MTLLLLLKNSLLKTICSMSVRRWMIVGYMVGTPIKKTIYHSTSGAELTRSQAQNLCFRRGLQFVSLRELR